MYASCREGFDLEGSSDRREAYLSDSVLHLHSRQPGWHLVEKVADKLAGVVTEQREDMAGKYGTNHDFMLPFQVSNTSSS
jgi:hypothetical protein